MLGNRSKQISPLGCFAQSRNKMIIKSESNHLRELKKDSSFHEGLQLIAGSKHGFKNFPIDKLMKLPLDLSHLKNYDNSELSIDKERMSNRTFYGNGNFLSKNVKLE